MAQALKKYMKKFPYSYTLGAFPTFELVKNQARHVEAVYLHSMMEGSDGARYPMAGVTGGSCSDSGSLSRFGYIEVTAEEGGLLCEKGQSFRAHEFHYWESTDPGASFKAVKPDGSRSWKCAIHTDTLYAGFPHMHFCGCPDIVRRFLAKCKEYRDKRNAGKK